MFEKPKEFPEKPGSLFDASQFFIFILSSTFRNIRTNKIRYVCWTQHLSLNDNDATNSRHWIALEYKIKNIFGGVKVMGKMDLDYCFFMLIYYGF